MGLSILLSLAFFTAAVSNGLVLCITFRSKKLQRLCYYNITSSLAVCDLLLLAVFVFHTVSAGTTDWPLSMQWCRILAALGYALGAITVLHLCAIAIERYSVILKPFHYREEVNYPTFGVILCGIWFFPVVFALSPIFADVSMYVYNPKAFRCELIWTDKSTPNLMYVAFLAFVYFLVPIVIIGFSYGRMFAVAKSHFRQINSLKPTNVTARKDKDHECHGCHLYRHGQLKPQQHQQPQQEQQLKQQQIQHLEQKQQQQQQPHLHQNKQQQTPSPPPPQQQQQQQQQEQQLQQLQQLKQQQQQQPRLHQNKQQQQSQQQQQGEEPQPQRQQCQQQYESQQPHSRQSSGSSTDRVVIRPNQASCPKAVKTIGIIIVIYGICYVPYSLVRILKVFFPHQVPEAVSVVTLLTALFSLSLNPVVYCFGKRDFRTELLKRMSCLRPVRNRVLVHPSNPRISGLGPTARSRIGLGTKLRFESASPRRSALQSVGCKKQQQQQQHHAKK